MHRTIKYKSPNGYSGMLYGKSSMIVRDPDGKEVMHTAFRNVNTIDELKKIVDDMPRFISVLLSVFKDEGGEKYDV